MKTIFDWLFADMLVWLYGDKPIARMYSVLCLWTHNGATYVEVYDVQAYSRESAIQKAKSLAWASGKDTSVCDFEV